MIPEKFVSEPIFVGLKETNLEGNVYWTHFFDWFSQVREQFLILLIPDFQERFKAGLRIITYEEYLRHIAPAFFSEKVSVKISVSEIKKVQACLSFEVENATTGHKLAEGWQILLFAATKDGSVPTKRDLIPIPEDIKKAGEKYHVVKK